MSGRLAALRERLVAASTHVPLPWALRALDGVSRVLAIDHPNAYRAAEVLGVPETARAEFARRAWYGTKAGELVRARLLRDPSLVDTLVSDALGEVEDGLRGGRGTILAGVHLGPEAVAPTLVWRRYPEVLLMVHEPRLLPPGANVIAVDERADRAAALLAARRHLRAGGLVYVAPDGVSGQLSVAAPVRGGTVRMSRGVAALARLAKAPTLVFAALWQRGGGIRIMAEPIAEPSEPLPDAWDVAWLAAYLAHVDRWTATSPPENLRIHGNIYERWSRSPAGLHGTRRF